MSNYWTLQANVQDQVKIRKNPVTKVIQQVREAQRVSDSSCEATAEEDLDDEVHQVYSTDSGMDKITCVVGGVKSEWIIDSGAHVNVERG